MRKFLTCLCFLLLASCSDDDFPFPPVGNPSPNPAPSPAPAPTPTLAPDASSKLFCISADTGDVFLIDLDDISNPSFAFSLGAGKDFAGLTFSPIRDSYFSYSRAENRLYEFNRSGNLLNSIVLDRTLVVGAGPRGMTVDEDGVLFMIGENNILYEVDPDSGVTVDVFQAVGPTSEIEAIAFLDRKAFLAVGVTSQLFLLDRVSGVLTNIYDAPVGDLDSMTGTVAGTVYMTESGPSGRALYAYNPLTKGFTNYGNIGGISNMNGLVEVYDPKSQSHSVKLDGTDDYLAILDGDQTSLEGMSDITMEAWVNLESVPPLDNTQVQVISKDRGGIERQYYISFQKTGSTDEISARFQTVSGPSTAIYAWTPILDTWFHIATTRDATTGEVRVFLNGTQYGATHFGTVGSIEADSIADFHIGARDSTGGDIQHLNGLVDEVRVWNTIRSQTEINENKNVKLLGTEAGLVGYWNFDDGFNDETANDNDLTPNGGAFRDSSNLAPVE